jgi:4-alpha-glucanotransferase
MGAGAIGAASPVTSRRRAGVLLHPSSLDGPHGVGDLGPAAHAFAKWCASTGFGWWQMLPIGPVGPGDSPYSSTSSFAGEPLLISLDALAAEGLLPPRAVRAAAARCAKSSKRLSARGPLARTDWRLARAVKMPMLAEAARAFESAGGFQSRDYLDFAHRERAWLEGWVRFAAARESHGPRHRFMQWAFDAQWRALRERCRALGVSLMGDIPIFVTLESADVRASPELFRLNGRGRPEVLTGCPPDCFSADGQLWGHPHYRWSAHRTQRFRWWVERVSVTMRRFDAARIDHFIGFHHAYEIPAGASNARRGQWKPQAGKEVLQAVRRALGAVPLVAEDLGAVTPGVIALREQFGLPGLKLLHHAFGHDGSADLPHHHPRNCVAYTGTHDNDTTIGWWRTLDAHAKRRCRTVCGPDVARAPHRAMARVLMESPAALAILPMQDVLGLDGRARMNLPGSPKGNWRWRLGRGWRAQASAASPGLRALICAAGRAATSQPA